MDGAEPGDVHQERPCLFPSGARLEGMGIEVVDIAQWRLVEQESIARDGIATLRRSLIGARDHISLQEILPNTDHRIMATPEMPALRQPFPRLHSEAGGGERAPKRAQRNSHFLNSLTSLEGGPISLNRARVERAPPSVSKFDRSCVPRSASTRG